MSDNEVVKPLRKLLPESIALGVMMFVAVFIAGFVAYPKLPLLADMFIIFFLAIFFGIVGFCIPYFTQGIGPP